ncbi:MAG: hypothetical protein WDZ62_00260 [Candidatus Pacearchaeota archaeon]
MKNKVLVIEEDFIISLTFKKFNKKDFPNIGFESFPTSKDLEQRISNKGFENVATLVLDNPSFKEYIVNKNQGDKLNSLKIPYILHNALGLHEGRKAVKEYGALASMEKPVTRKEYFNNIDKALRYFSKK